MLYNKIKSIMDEVFQENKKYKQALAEIRETLEWKNEYWSIGIGDYKDMVDDALQIIGETLDG